MRHKSTTVTHHNGDVAGNRQNFGSVNNLGLELGPRDVQDVGYDGVHNKFGVRAKFGAGEGGDAIDEERGGTLHIANEELGQRRVNLEPVAAVPVAAGLGQLGGLVNDLGGLLVVPVEQRDAGGLHEAVDLLAAAELGEGEDLVVGLEGLVLGQGLGREPRHFEPCVEDLHVTGVLLGVLDLLLELLHLGFVPALHGGKVGIRKASRLALPTEGRHEVPVQAGILHLLTADQLHHRLGQVGGDARRLGTPGVEGRV